MSRPKPKRSSSLRYIVLNLILLTGGIVLLKLIPPPMSTPLPPRVKRGIFHIPRSKEETGKPREGQVPPPTKSTVHPRLAIIIDDLGTNRKVAESLVRLDFPLTFSILPSLPYSVAIAQLATEHHREVLLHLPMEPHKYNRNSSRRGDDILLTEMSPAELERLTERLLARVPNIVGVNNHMGSRFTEDSEKMRVVLRVLRERGLFFVDSRTSKDSVAYQVAKELGLKAGQRRIFLDNRHEEGYVIRQLLKIKEIAEREGDGARIIAIGHPHPSTIRALVKVLPELKSAGIEIVPVSELVN